MKIDIEDQIKSVQREIKMRERVYPRFILRGKMTQKKADFEIAAMTEVLSSLKAIEDQVKTQGELKL